MIGNSFHVVGRLTRDPVLRYGAASQKAYTSFTIAVNYGKDKDGKDIVDYPEVTAFGKTAENIERCTGKGQMIAVDGHLRKGHYKNKDGNDVWELQAIVDAVKFISFKPKSEEKREAAPGPERYEDPVDASFEDFQRMPDELDF